MKLSEILNPSPVEVSLAALILFGLIGCVPTTPSPEYYQQKHDSISTAVVDQATNPGLYSETYFGCQASAVGIRLKNYSPVENADIISFGSGSAIMRTDTVDSATGESYQRFYYLSATHVYDQYVAPPFDVTIDSFEVLSAESFGNPLSKTLLNLEHVLPIVNSDQTSTMSLYVTNNKGMNGIEPPFVTYSGTGMITGWQENGGVMRFRAFPAIEGEQQMVVAKLINTQKSIHNYPVMGEIRFFEYFPGFSMVSGGASGAVGCLDTQFDGYDEMVAMMFAGHWEDPGLEALTVFSDDTRRQVEQWITQISGVSFP